MIYIFICPECGSKIERQRDKRETIGPRPVCWDCLCVMKRKKEDERV